MNTADLVRAALAFALPFVDDNVIHVYLIAVGLSIGAVFFNPAAQSVLPTLVKERELVAANSGLWTAAVIAQVVLAPLAGLVVATLGYSWAFWINSASYLASAGALLALKIPSTPARTRPTSWFRDAAEGFTELGANPLLRTLATVQLLAALSAGATGALLVVLAQDHLGLDEGEYGLLLGAIGVGAAIGPLVLTRFTDNPRRPGFVLGPFVARGLVDVVLATITGLISAMATLIVYGLSTSTGAVTFNSLLQSEVQVAGSPSRSPVTM